MARLSERFIIVAIILLTCLLLMRVYRDKIQKIDLNLDTGTTKGGIVASFSMPVFLLLALVAFAYLAFAHPVHYERTINQPGNGAPDVDPSDVSQPNSNIVWNGFGGSEDEIRKWVRALAVLDRSISELNDLKSAGLLQGESVNAAIEQAFIQGQELAPLRNSLLDELHPEGNPLQNCRQFIINRDRNPSEQCAAYVEDYLLGVEQ